MSETYIIAEIGNNHNGQLSKAKALIDMAAKTGVNAVKFQSFRGEDIVSPKVLTKEYKGWNNFGFKYWIDFANSVALPLSKHQELIDYTHEKELDFITTPVSPFIVDFLETLTGIDAYKVASMDLTNFGLLNSISKTSKPVLLSTGMGNLNEIKRAISIIGNNVTKVLHCVSDYPLDPFNANLNNIKVLTKEFPDLEIGFSDHSLGHEISLSAVAIGAKVIEKHITLNRKDELPAEHHFSLEYDEIINMVRWIRILDKNLSYNNWRRSPNESHGRKVNRRSFHYKESFDKGHEIHESDLVFLRPGDGIDYEELNSIVGKRLKRKVVKFSACLKSDF